MPRNNKIDYPLDEIKRMIDVDNLSAKKIAIILSERFGVKLSTSGIYAVCRRNGIRSNIDRSGSNNANWKGGETTTTDGYISVYRPDHPMALRGRVLEHRLVVSESIGRPLRDGEVVHHIDGNKQNNSIDNLQLFSSNGEHLSVTRKGICPNWTAEGRASINIAARKPRRKVR